jgi:hypothetical protein
MDEVILNRIYIYLFIMNQQSESYRQNIYVGVGVMKDYKLNGITWDEFFMMTQAA